MPDLNTQSTPYAIQAFSHWGAIWTGVFTFIAIWSVFGVLCLAIFAGSPNLDIAMSVWGIILTIIAMFVAGRTTGTLIGISNSREGVGYGITMFGLAVASTLVILAVGASMFGGSEVGGAADKVLGIFSNFGCALFVGIFLAWLAAIGGAASAYRGFAQRVPTPMQHQVGHAA